MTMRISAVCFHLAVLFIANGCAVQQQKIEPTGTSMRQAIARGEAKEFLVALEVMGSEAEKKGRWVEASMAYTRASAAARETGQLQKAIAHGTAAVEMAQRAKDALAQSSAIRRLGDVYKSLGQFEREREWLQRGLEVAKQISGGRKEGEQALLYGRLGTNFLRQGELQNAIEYISHSVQILDSTLSYYRSLRLYLKPKPIPQQESDLVDALNRLGVAYLRAGNAQEAIRAFERGLTIVKTSKLDAPAEGSLSLGLGQAYVAQKDFLRAMENLSKALQMAEARRQTSTIQAASNAIGEIFLQTEKPSEAIPYYKKAIDSIESTRALLESEEFRTSFFANKGQTYDGMILAQLRTGNVEEAFNYNERARSRAFLDILGNKVQLGRQRALLEEERALLAKISEVRARLAGQGDDGEGESDSGPTQLRQEMDAAQKVYTDFLAKVRKENKEQASLMNVEPLTLKQVQDLIDPGQTLIEYFVTDSEVFVWVVEKDKLNFHRVAISKNELAKQVKSLREIISNPGDARELNEASASLYKSLFQPLLPHITGKELIIVPHDVLHYLPFQALIGPDGRYLVEKYPINYLSSASLLQFTKEKSRAMGEKVLAFGNPDLNEPKMSLQFAEIEAKEIKGLYPQSTIYLEKEATEEKAKSLSPQNDIIHFASHAELNENDPLSSAVLLAKSDKEDGRLEVREIFGMDLKASLVVLSACETGLGKLSSGDELVGLTRAFIYAGTPSVVASLWNVEDSSTAQLMASFYRNLKTMTKVEALRQAQLNLIRGNVNSDLLARRGIGGVGKLGEVPAAKSLSQDSVSPPVSVSTSHPYFWAPFILVGEGK